MEEKHPLLLDAERSFRDKKFDDCFAHLKSYWLDNFSDIEAVKLFSLLMKELAHNDLSANFAALCTEDGQVVDDPKLLFELGYRLIDTRQYELATMLLKRCAEKVPDDASLNYELGFVLMLQKKYAEAIPYLERSFAHEMIFDTALNLSACFALCRRINDARGLISRLNNLADTDEESLAVSQQDDILKRLEHFAGQAELDARDWAYALYGSILLDADTELVEESHLSVAKTLLVLRHFLQASEADLTAIEFFNMKARPLAECVARMLKLPVQGYKGPGQSGKVLTVIANGEDMIGPHRSFLANSAERSLFVYSLGVEPLPLVMELAGKLNDVSLPWDNETELTEFKASTERLVEAIAELEKDDEAKIQAEKLVAYYQKKNSLLLWRNSNNFAERPQYTAEIP